MCDEYLFSHVIRLFSISWFVCFVMRAQKHDLFWAAHFRSTAVKTALDGAANHGLRVLLMRMLAPNPEDRPSLVEIATNPWIAGPIMR